MPAENRRLLGLLGTQQHGCIVAELGRSIDQSLNCGRTRVGLTVQDPEVPPRGLTDDRPAVVVSVVEHPIITIEGTEETDLQLGVRLRIDHLRAASGFSCSAIWFATPVDDPDAAVG